jgi:pyruvate dehydrogenase complex dehydrogenase (E1) component
MTDVAIQRGSESVPTPDELAVLERIHQRVLWLAVRIVDYANRERPSDDELKVGGHQASSASVVTLMTALYFADLRAEDRVSIKPHASPVLHAIEYLLGRLPREYLTTLREFGGLQPYPSRTKDPFPVDYSTGSVGLGAAAPLFGGLQPYPSRTKDPFPVDYSRARSASARPRRSSARSPTATSPRISAVAAGAAGDSSPCSATPSWTRGTCGRRSSSR